MGLFDRNIGNGRLLPQPYLEMVSGYIGKIKNDIEKGETINSHVLLFNSGAKVMDVIFLDVSSVSSKDASAAFVREAADRMGADCAIMVSEAWGLSTKDRKRAADIYKKYGSLAHYPERSEIMTFAVEIQEGTWIGTAEIVFKYPSKKKRTFGPVELVDAKGIEGRFIGFLSNKHMAVH